MERAAGLCHKMPRSKGWAGMDERNQWRRRSSGGANGRGAALRRQAVPSAVALGSASGPHVSAALLPQALSYAPHGLADGIAALAAEPVFAAILAEAGPPRFRRRRNGFATLLHIILEQQVSIDAAAAMHRRLSEVCRPLTPEAFLTLDDADPARLRLQPAEDGLRPRSRRKSPRRRIRFRPARRSRRRDARRRRCWR